MDDALASYRDRLGLEGAAFELIEHEDAIIALVYRVTHGSQKLVLKICPHEKHYRREVYFLQQLAGVIPLPRLLGTVDPEPGLHGAVLLEFVEGKLLQEWSEPLAFEVGETLARIHSQSAEGYGDLTRPETLVSDPTQYFAAKFEEELDECRGHLPAETIERAEQCYADHRDQLAAVDGPCLVHRDFRPGNLLVKEGKLAAVIDWAGAHGGFAEQGFCLVEHRGFPSQPAHKEALLGGYASVRPLPHYQRIMPLLQVGRALAVIGFTVRTETWKGDNARLYQYNRRFLEENLGG